MSRRDIPALAGMLLPSAPTAAGGAALLYIAIDGAILAGAGVAASVWAWEALSYGTKLLAALAGATFAARPTAR